MTSVPQVLRPGPFSVRPCETVSTALGQVVAHSYDELWTTGETKAEVAVQGHSVTMEPRSWLQIPAGFKHSFRGSPSDAPLIQRLEWPSVVPASIRVHGEVKTSPQRLRWNRLVQEGGWLADPVLDIGCAKYDVLSMRSNTVTIDLDHKNHPDIVADCLKLPFKSGSFETVVAFGLLESVPAFMLAIEEMVRVARPRGGRIVLGLPGSGSHVRSSNDPPFADLIRFSADFCSWVSSHFGLSVLESIDLLDRYYIVLFAQER